MPRSTWRPSRPASTCTRKSRWPSPASLGAPLSMRRQQAACVWAAHDTFLGAGIQTCLRLMEQGEVGTALAASGFMLNRGPESLHLNPAFFYQPGGGPLLYVGPYYVTTMVCLLGPVGRVTGMSRILFPERTAVSGPRAS